MSLQNQERKHSEDSNTPHIVVPFTALRRDALALVGGKGANLGELTGAGLPVPPGFCITTVAYEIVASEAGLELTVTSLPFVPLRAFRFRRSPSPFRSTTEGTEPHGKQSAFFRDLLCFPWFQKTVEAARHCSARD